MKRLRMVMLTPVRPGESDSVADGVLDLDSDAAWELFRAGRARLEDPSDWAAVNWVLQRAAVCGAERIPGAAAKGATTM